MDSLVLLCRVGARVWPFLTTLASAWSKLSLWRSAKYSEVDFAIFSNQTVGGFR